MLPVRPPARVDRDVAGRAMLLAPLAGALLAVLAGGALWLLDRVASPLLAATLAVGLLALLTRGMHLDGLADTADGLGSRRPADGALEVMRRGDVGPFGVVTLVRRAAGPGRRPGRGTGRPGGAGRRAAGAPVRRCRCSAGAGSRRPAPRASAPWSRARSPPVAAAATVLGTVVVAGAVGWSTYGSAGWWRAVLALAAGAVVRPALRAPVRRDHR